MSAHCNFINGQCEHSGKLNECISESAVSCRTRRDRIEKERTNAAKSDTVQG